jgi:RNA polymerase sigma-70 factor (ECF subfamily)
MYFASFYSVNENQHSPNEDELRRWLDAAGKGDQHSFSLLLRQYWNKVYSQALTYLKSAPLAQEITQDVFLKIWKTREKLSGLDHFPDYLFIISRNAIISELRKKGRQRFPDFRIFSIPGP